MCAPVRISLCLKHNLLAWTHFVCRQLIRGQCILSLDREICFSSYAHQKKKSWKLNAMRVSLGIFGIASAVSCPGMVGCAWIIDGIEMYGAIFEIMIFYYRPIHRLDILPKRLKIAATAITFTLQHLVGSHACRHAGCMVKCHDALQQASACVERVVLDIFVKVCALLDLQK